MRRSHFVPLAVAGLALVLASCGGQPFPQSAGTPTTARSAAPNPEATRDPHAWLLASVQRTSTLTSARLAMTMKISGLADETLTAGGTGGIDFVKHSVALSLRGEDNGETVSVEVRVVGGTIYTRSDGEDWISKPVDSVDVDTPNPSSYLNYLQAVSSDVRVEGHETLRGVDTTRYSAEMNFDRALMHATNAAQRKLFAQALTLFGGVKMPVTAWIDGNGYVRKEEVSLDLGTALREAGAPVTGHPAIVVTLELYDFGAPITIVAPTGAIDATAVAQNRAAQSDLRNALTTEKTYFTDSQIYTDDIATLKEIESSLDWGGKLHVVVGSAQGLSDAVVCLSQTSASGQAFSLADVSSGPYAGTYYGRSLCPSVISDVSMSRLAKNW